MGLREATAELHSKAEKMEFNQRMLKGELSKDEYCKYLVSQLEIFSAIEEKIKPFPHESLKRKYAIIDDLKSLDFHQLEIVDNATSDYVRYLTELETESVIPHIYLNYLAIMFGGQMIKSKVPGSGKMYEFENTQECIGVIRALQKDEWVDEVNKGFTYIINILDELQRKTF
jgi:heme oxygenase